MSKALTREQRLVKSFVSNYNKSNKDTVIEVLDILKDKESREENTATLLEQAKAIKTDSTSRALKKLVTNVNTYLTIDVEVNFKDISYDNLIKLINLIKYVNKHYEGDKTKFNVVSIYTKGMSAYRYNNDLEAVLVALRKELLVPIIPKKYEYEEAYKIVETLSPSDLKLLMDTLLEKVYPTQEVA